MDDEEPCENTAPKNEEIKLKPFYVYELQDPDSGEVFYIGKGKGGRVGHHEMEADRTSETDSKKLEKIREIKSRSIGKKPRALVIARFDTPEEAFAVEATLMHWVQGFPGHANNGSHLTNIQAGHNHKDIRPKGNFKEHLPNIDVPPIRANNGAYIAVHVAGGIANNVEEKLHGLREFFLEHNPDWEKNLVVDMTNRRHPSLYLTVAESARIQCILPALSGKSLILNVRAVNNSQVSFSELFNQLKCEGESTELKNKSETPYFKISGMEDPLPLEQRDAFLNRFKSAWALVSIASEKLLQRPATP